LIFDSRDCLFRLSLDDLAQIELAEWKPEDPSKCMFKGQAQEDCHNFIRVLLLHDEMIFTCGTNAFKPLCQWRYASNLTAINGTVDGRAKCPFNPHHNATALITDDGDLYTATAVDFAATDPSINRNLGPSKPLRTVRSNSKWLNEPNFISVYEIDDFIYFFFRETAVEFINCGKKIYSRVARVCKSDNGGRFLLEDNWTSFQKARINCSIPGDFPFYFDEMQSTFYSEDKVYAILTTPPNSIAGSAVCVYNLTAFNTAFTGDFKYQENGQSAWMRHDNPKPMERSAGSSSKRSSEMSGEPLVVAQQYQLMNEAVQPVNKKPLLFGEKERWTHIVVDHVIGKEDIYDVVFLATEDGKIKKMISLHDNNLTCLIEEIKIVPNGAKRPVKAMKISSEKGAVFISTHGKIIKVPVERCHRFTDPDLCVNARDPYCGWNSRINQCAGPPGGNPHVDYWIQHIESCPILNYPVNGNWSDWGDWQVCQQINTDKDDDDCMCRSRYCNKPEPLFGGRPCRGPNVEVTNCTVHGQWTEWSSWSSCSKTCGFAVKYRTRHCGNPAPRYGGRICIGDNTESQYCENLEPCPVPPRHGKWSVWSGWSACTANCNGGIQNRRRLCNDPQPAQGGTPCIGDKQDWRMCNSQTCEEHTKVTKWTPWIKTNITAAGHLEQRFRFSCRAPVLDKNMIKSDFAKGQTRVCFDGKSDCLKPRDFKDTISPIDTYSSVHRVFKKYCRFRRKLFKKYCNCRTLGVFLVCQKCGYG
ncbi:hypothetical protein LOTGIDRAFT_107562, partial [Lottia gigantea]